MQKQTDSPWLVGHQQQVNKSYLWVALGHAIELTKDDHILKL